MNESIGWSIYALACTVFAGMALARKERPPLQLNDRDVYEIDDFWHDFGGGSMLEPPFIPLSMAESKALIEKAIARVNGTKTDVFIMEHGTAQITPEMDQYIRNIAARNVAQQ